MTGGPRVRQLESIADVDARTWDALIDTDQPALQHAFLCALEETGAASPETGWHPGHVIVEEANGRLLGAMPLYAKDHSFGEFVFDFAWAEAWQRTGRPYYPKLVSAIPFTPLDGPRLLLAPDAPGDTTDLLLRAAETQCRDSGMSTIHALFCDQSQFEQYTDRDWLRRDGTRFVWENRDYPSFDDWLAALRSRKRKNLRRERRHVHEAGFRFALYAGSDLHTLDWEEIYQAYAATYWLRGQRPYLPQEFFPRIAREMPDSLVVVEARNQSGALHGVAIFLQGTRTLYGRHWGRPPQHPDEPDGLHFETCYYQGMEYCIRAGLTRFDPGIQGEHKLLRGFAPQTTHSFHWIPETDLHAAVRDFVHEESKHNEAYQLAARQHLPFPKGGVS